MTTRTLPGRLGQVELDGELPRRDDLPKVFDELDHQLACQDYLWALPLVSYAQWQLQHREVFGAGPTDPCTTSAPTRPPSAARRRPTRRMPRRPRG
jgi:hypothetical protein